jgi:hypothetical protein
MKKNILRTLMIALSAPTLFQPGCFNASDFRAIAEGQFIGFVNALIGSVVSDLIRGVTGG